MKNNDLLLEKTYCTVGGEAMTYWIRGRRRLVRRGGVGRHFHTAGRVKIVVASFQFILLVIKQINNIDNRTIPSMQQRNCERGDLQLTIYEYFSFKYDCFTWFSLSLFFSPFHHISPWFIGWTYSVLSMTPGESQFQVSYLTLLLFDLSVVFS